MWVQPTPVVRHGSLKLLLFCSVQLWHLCVIPLTTWTAAVDQATDWPESARLGSSYSVVDTLAAWSVWLSRAMEH